MPELDEKDWALLEALQEDARLSYAELGRRVGLSPPAATERVKRLEDHGIITAYRAVVDPAKLGKGLSVLIRVSIPNKDYQKFQRFLGDTPEVLECHHISGSEAFQIRAAVASVADLETLLHRISAYGQTATSLVLSTSMERRVFRNPAKSKRAGRQ